MHISHFMISIEGSLQPGHNHPQVSSSLPEGFFLGSFPCSLCHRHAVSLDHHIVLYQNSDGVYVYVVTSEYCNLYKKCF